MRRLSGFIGRLSPTLLVYALAGGIVIALGAGSVTDEYRVKAAFVFKFPQFVDWPSAAWTGRDRVEICVTRPTPFGKALHELVAGETLNGRTMAVREVDREDQIATCHVLFVSVDGAPARILLGKAAVLPVLTVGESPGFLDEGGIISLRTVQGRVRFDINTVAADRAGLRLSSQLLRLALTVRGGQS
jgi:hypothetical protein